MLEFIEALTNNDWQVGCVDKIPHQIRASLYGCKGPWAETKQTGKKQISSRPRANIQMTVERGLAKTAVSSSVRHACSLFLMIILGGSIRVLHIH